MESSKGFFRGSGETNLRAFFYPLDGSQKICTFFDRID